MVQLSATRCNCIAVLCVSLVSFAAITLCIAPQRVFIIIIVIIIIYFVIASVRKLMNTPSYTKKELIINQVIAFGIFDTDFKSSKHINISSKNIQMCIHEINT
jgi:hypothetical protein